MDTYLFSEHLYNTVIHSIGVVVKCKIPLKVALVALGTLKTRNLLTVSLLHSSHSKDL